MPGPGWAVNVNKTSGGSAIFILASALAILGAGAEPVAPATKGRGPDSLVTAPIGWAAIHSGMAEADLTQILGSDYQVSGPADFKILTYAQGEVFLQDGRVVAWKARPTAAPAPDSGARGGAGRPVAAAPDAEARHQAGLPRHKITDYIRAYEPNEGGQTWDQGNDSFFDFTFSIMLPLLPAVFGGPGDPGTDATQYYAPVFRPPGPTLASPFRTWQFYSYRPSVYFAMNAQQGFYWFGSRYSSPVISKRMNPLVSFRWWAAAHPDDPRAGKAMESDDNFVELVYAHESNGQYLDTLDGFTSQVATYQHRLVPRPDGDNYGEAFRHARDNLSRGWDYVGLQFSRDWDWEGEGKSFWTLNLRAKYNYYLPYGLLQHREEEYRAWEADPEGKPRKYVDGTSIRLTGVHREPAGKSWKGDWWFPMLPDRFAATWTTGSAHPGRFNTWKFEASLPFVRLVPVVGKLPAMLWYRDGYNVNQIDYFRKNRSFGIKLSIWKFTTEE